MPAAYIPPEELKLYCRFCNKITPATLEKVVAAENGRTINEESTLEYVCAKCHKIHCYYGKDILEAEKDEDGNNTLPQTEPKQYNIRDTYKIGEIIIHPSSDTPGVVVGKVPGKISKIVVTFDGKKVTNFVEGIAK